MYGLSIGVSSIDQSLPRPVYGLLSGLNAATVGVIALAAVELSEKAITDKLTRILVFLGATAGLLYNSLWYFPVLMLVAGCATLVHDYRLVTWLAKMTGMTKERQQSPEEPGQQLPADDDDHVNLQAMPGNSHLGTATQRSTTPASTRPEPTSLQNSDEVGEEPRVIPREIQLDISWQTGTIIIASFLVAFIVIMVLRGALTNPPLLFRLFANMFLAGTIIFGGGPVVIPLLREYVVAEGWVSPRDFLIGLAIIQAMPGPNFDFAVFLGSLTAINTGNSSAAGAILAWFAIFSPGISVVHGTMGIWSALRSKRWFKSLLRGINAAAVGLIYTAVYRIWIVGYLDQGFEYGRSLGDDPWWVVVSATSFVGGRWFHLQAVVAILLGAAMGLIRYGVVYAEGY
jgi:chromate transport protein ChrA